VTKKLAAGGEVDSYCTKCRMDLNHRIIAMVGDTVKKVECLTCGSHHLYRKPMSERTSSAAKPKRTSTRSATAERVTAAAKAEREQLAYWEGAIAGQPASAFRAYTIGEVFSVGELVRHKKFGDGVVARVIDRGKVEVLFQDGVRTMAHGQ
jgi:Zn ribbon nucleic-acid-binding protein